MTIPPTPRPDAPVEQRHREAAESLHNRCGLYFNVHAVAQALANAERDAYERGLRDGIRDGDAVGLATGIAIGEQREREALAKGWDARASGYMNRRDREPESHYERREDLMALAMAARAEAAAIRQRGEEKM